MPESEEKPKLSKEEKAAKKAAKEAKAAKKAAKEATAAATMSPGGRRQSPRLQAMAATADALPALDLGPPAAADKADKKANKRAAGADAAADAPAAKKAKGEKTDKKEKKEKKKKEEESSTEEEAGGAASSAALTPDEYRAAHDISGSSALPPPVQKIEDAPFEPRLRASMTAAGYTAPSAIQAQSWPVSLTGADVIAIAKTGSGKTVGFLMPAFQAILPKLPLTQGQGPLALVMAPVRELAQQIQVEAERFGGAVGIKSVCVYGGAPKGPQVIANHL